MSSETIQAEQPVRCRRFAVSDGMTFIAGVALIFAAGGAELFVNLAEQDVTTDSGQRRDVAIFAFGEVRGQLYV